MATTTINYGTENQITLTAPSSGNARESTAVDNSSTKAVDYLCRISFTAGTVTGLQLVLVYAYGSADGTNYESVCTGSDAAITLRNPDVLMPVAAIQLPTSSVAYKKVFTIAKAWDGVMPKKWGLVLLNDGGGTLSSLAIYYTPIKYDVA